MDNAGRMALRDKDMISHIHRFCGHMSDPYIKWHRENSKNAKFTDADAKKVRPYARLAYMEKTDRHQPTDTAYIGHYQQYQGNVLQWMRLHVGTYLIEVTNFVM